MKLLLLSSNPEAPSTKSLIQTARSRGLFTFSVAPEQLSFVFGLHNQCFVQGQSQGPSEGQDRSQKLLQEISPKEYTWAMARIGWTDRVRSLRCLELLENCGFRLINSARAFARAQDKISTSLKLIQSGVPVPQSSWAHQALDSETALNLLAKEHLGVVKWPFGSQGYGTFISEERATLKAHIDSLRSVEAEFFLQEFIHQDARELRFLMFRQEVLACGQKGPSRDQDRRRNSRQGGSFEYYQPSPEEVRLAQKIMEATELDFAGIDLIATQGKLFCLDVNPTPGFSALQKVHPENIADLLINSIRCQAPNGSAPVSGNRAW